MVQLPPGVDEKTFHPGVGRRGASARGSGSADRPVVVCVSRLVPRKGQDTLIRALPRDPGARCPDAVLLIVGGGPYERDPAEAAPRRPGWPARCASPARCPGRSCPRTTAPATSSRCRAAPGGAASTSRGSASSTWRRPRPACRWSRATRAARRTRCSTARRAGSSGGGLGRATAADRDRRPCCGDPGCGAGWASGAGPGSRRSGAGTCSRSAQRLLLRALASDGRPRWLDSRPTAAGQDW